MTINLADIPAAVASYMNTKVTTVVDPVTADSGSLNPTEEGSFKVTVTNADAPNGVRLVDVVHHLTIAPSNFAKLKVHPSAAIATRATLDPGAPLLARSTFVEEMYATYLTGTLEVGETRELTFEVKGLDEGNATITCHIHANIDENSLFPSGENSSTIRRAVAVV